MDMELLGTRRFAVVRDDFEQHQVRSTAAAPATAAVTSATAGIVPGFQGVTHLLMHQGRRIKWRGVPSGLCSGPPT